MTYEKFEHKVIGMLLEGNDPKLETLLMQALDREVVSRVDGETGFTVEFLAPSPLSINESEGKVFGVEIELSDQPIIQLELTIKDGLIHQLNGYYTTETSYSEIVSRFNELTFIYTNQHSSITDFHSDNHDPLEVTFVKNIATISKEIDAHISNPPSEDEDIIENDDNILTKEPFDRTTEEDLKPLVEAEMIEESEPLPEIQKPDETQENSIVAAETDVIKKPSRLALKVEELKKAAQAIPVDLPEEPTELDPVIEEEDESVAPVSLEAVIEEEPESEDELVLPVSMDLPVESIESEAVVKEEDESLELVSPEAVVEEELESDEELVSSEAIIEEKPESDEEPVLSEAVIEEESELIAPVSSDEEPDEEKEVEKPALPKSSYIAQLEEAILRKLEAEDPSFIRRPRLEETEDLSQLESTPIEEEPLVVIDEKIAEPEVFEKPTDFEVPIVDEKPEAVIPDEPIAVPIVKDIVDEPPVVIEKVPMEEPVVEDVAPKRMSLEEYMKQDFQDSILDEPEKAVDPAKNIPVQQSQPVQSMRDPQTLQYVEERGKMSIGMKVGIFLIVLGIIVLIAFFLVTPLW